MPKTPTGAKRPADVIGNAVHVMRIATGQVEEKPDEKDPAAVKRGRSGGLEGGKARAKALSAKQRKTIAKAAAAARWGNKK
jgi:hypothetical protein